MARSIAARLVRGFGMQRGVFQPGAGTGDRGAQVVGDGIGNAAHAIHQAADAVQHVVDHVRHLIEFVAASGQPDALGEVAAGDGARGGGDVGQRAAEQVAHDQCADGRHQDHHDGGPEKSVGQHFAQMRTHLNVAADQQVKAAGQIVALNIRQ